MGIRINPTPARDERAGNRRAAGDDAVMVITAAGVTYVPVATPPAADAAVTATPTATVHAATAAVEPETPADPAIAAVRDGNVIDARAAVEATTTLAALDVLAAVEAAGKSRSTVLGLIERRRAALGGQCSCS